MASVGAPRGHSLLAGPAAPVRWRGLGGVLPLETAARRRARARFSPTEVSAGPSLLRQRSASLLARVVVLLVFPDRQRGGCDAPGESQLGQVGLDARLADHALEVFVQWMLGHLVDDRGRRALEEGF